ncbi:hypothetical protein TSUD_99590 [Trifolium subterraneum]|uniref:Uncharacterized protein n=1 Tax=Trifolium subterraneum TaxID=3900 RepID=A0A2Z6PG42_TRISU|nr:hypothetical protein TSUD_99590 [Trifolium subterraneum]
MTEQDKLGAFSDNPSSQSEDILSSQDNNFQGVSNVTTLDSKPHHTIDFLHPDANPIAPPPSKYPLDDQGSKVCMGDMSSFFCCAIGWTFFVLGFILLTIPWFV